jgi:hypothetical protein
LFSIIYILFRFVFDIPDPVIDWVFQRRADTVTPRPGTVSHRRSPSPQILRVDFSTAVEKLWDSCVATLSEIVERFT